MTEQNPMVPSVNWGEASKGFAERMQQGRQELLCAICVMDLGLTTAPSQVVILGGQSYCLDHLTNPE